METSNTRNLNYNFIAVPTNLFFALDNNLRNALTVLLQLSSVFADSNGYFFRTNEDLQTDFKMGKNLTIAVLESLYQYGLLQVKSVGFTKKNGRKQVNFYRVNVEKFKDFEQFHIYTITKNEELHLETVDYKSKDFKVTYTASTVEDSETSTINVQNNVARETPSTECKNVSERKEIMNIGTAEVVTNSGVDEVEETNKIVEEVEETPTTFDTDDSDIKPLDNTELELRLIQYYNDNKDSIATEEQYNEFETVYNMVLNNYKENEQITFDQFNHAKLFIIQPKLSELRYKISKSEQIETRSLKPSNTDTLTTAKITANNVTEEKEIALDGEFINPIGVVADTKTDEEEILYTKLITRMAVLLGGCTNLKELKETYNKVVEGIEKTFEEGKISKYNYAQLKEKAWWLFTENFNKNNTKY